MDDLEFRVNLVRRWRFEDDPELAAFFGQVAMDALTQDEDYSMRAPNPDRVHVTPFLDDDEGALGFVVDSYVDLEFGSWHVGHHRLMLLEVEMSYGPGSYLALADTGEQVGDILGRRSPEWLSLVDMATTHLHEQHVLSPN